MRWVIVGLGIWVILASMWMSESFMGLTCGHSHHYGGVLWRRRVATSFEGDAIAEKMPSLASEASGVVGLSMIRHGRRVKKLGKPADQRKALMRALTTEVIRHGNIKTTLIRAKAVRKHVDHMITLSKRGTLHARRQALGYIYDKELVRALFEKGPERYGERPGGYCRVTRIHEGRRGDNAKMATIELV